MCGIAGVMTPGRRDAIEAAVDRMIAAARHRGPDGAARVSIGPLLGDRHLVLGHARLSILDLSDAAAQPMHDPATESWLIFNGEIYNFRELRAELAGYGCEFDSSGDTEVLLRALVHWGVAALPRLRGMFALAFWDGRTRLLRLARDTCGIKPLLLARSGETLLFASELRQIRAAGLVPLSLNREALATYLAYGMTVEPATIANEVVAVPPGHVVTIDQCGVVRGPEAVCALSQVLVGGTSAAGDGSEADPRRVTRSRLGAAVTAHLVSDVPVGVFLSGGIDSSILAAAADSNPNVHYLTVGYPEIEFSEIPHAERVAKRLGGKHHVIHVTSDDLLRALPAAMDAMDQPTADGFNTFVIARAGADIGLKVLLSGLGGDEVFGGYTTFRKAPALARYRRLVGPAAAAAWRVGIRAGVQQHKAARASRLNGLVDAYLLQRSIRWGGATAGVDERAVPPEDFAIPGEAWTGLLDAPGSDDMHRVAFLEMSFYMRNQLLRDADIFSSANSVELRVPFLDVDVIRCGWQLDASALLSRRENKVVLRRVLEDLVPGLPGRREKMGFVFPWLSWLRGPLFEVVRDTIGDRDTCATLGIDPDAAVRVLDAFKAGDRVVTWAQIWSLFVVLRWQREMRLAA